MVKIMVKTTTRMITEETTLRVFLLFILNIFITLLSYKINKSPSILLKGYYTMKFPILASFLVFIVIVAIFNKRTTNIHKKRNEEYWERERKSNFVRKKSLDDLDYISIPFSSFPMAIAAEDETIASCHKELESLRDEKIVNFTGYSNTDLKLEYGTANINVLSQYDQNYTLFVRTLHSWGSRLHELGYKDEALTVLEYAIATRTDISGTYYLAASIYHEKSQPDKIKHLLFVADTLQSAMKGPIVRTLKESYPDIG